MDSGMLNSSEVDSGLLWYKCGSPFFFLYVTCDISNSVLGLSTNLWVLVLILKNWRAQSAQELFTLNLAVVEIIYCLLSQALVLNYLVLKLPYFNQFFWFVFGLNICGRSFFQCGMSVERYLAVVHPVFFFKYQALRYKVMFFVISWPIIITICIYHHLDFMIYTICSLFLLVLTVDSFCSLSILKVLCQPSPGEGGKKTDQMNLMKKRALRTVLIIQASVMINYLPVFFGAAFYKYMSKYVFLCVYKPVGFSFTVMGSFIQPLLYLQRMRKIPWTAS